MKYNGATAAVACDIHTRQLYTRDLVLCYVSLQSLRWNSSLDQGFSTSLEGRQGGGQDQAWTREGRLSPPHYARPD